MKIDPYLILLVILIMSLTLNVIQQIISVLRRKVIVGDTVLYNDVQNLNTAERNMITQVLKVYNSYNTAVIRVGNTTRVVSQKVLTKLHTDKKFSIKINGKRLVQTQGSTKNRW